MLMCILACFEATIQWNTAWNHKAILAGRVFRVTYKSIIPPSFMLLSNSEQFSAWQLHYHEFCCFEEFKSWHPWRSVPQINAVIVLVYVERKEKRCKTQCSGQIKREDKMWANWGTNIEPGTKPQSNLGTRLPLVVWRKFVRNHFGGLRGNRERKFFQIRIFNGSNPEEEDFDKDTARINSIWSEYSTLACLIQGQTYDEFVPQTLTTWIADINFVVSPVEFFVAQAQECGLFKC